MKRQCQILDINIMLLQMIQSNFIRNVIQNVQSPMTETIQAYSQQAPLGLFLDTHPREVQTPQ